MGGWWWWVGGPPTHHNPPSEFPKNGIMMGNGGFFQNWKKDNMPIFSIAKVPQSLFFKFFKIEITNA